MPERLPEPQRKNAEPERNTQDGQQAGVIHTPDTFQGQITHLQHTEGNTEVIKKINRGVIPNRSRPSKFIQSKMIVSENKTQEAENQSEDPTLSEKVEPVAVTGGDEGSGSSSGSEQNANTNDYETNQTDTALPHSAALKPAAVDEQSAEQKDQVPTSQLEQETKTETATVAQETTEQNTAPSVELSLSPQQAQETVAPAEVENVPPELEPAESQKDTEQKSLENEGIEAKPAVAEAPTPDVTVPAPEAGKQEAISSGTLKENTQQTAITQEPTTTQADSAPAITSVESAITETSTSVEPLQIPQETEPEPAMSEEDAEAETIKKMEEAAASEAPAEEVAEPIRLDDVDLETVAQEEESEHQESATPLMRSPDMSGGAPAEAVAEGDMGDESILSDKEREAALGSITPEPEYTGSGGGGGGSALAEKPEPEAPDVSGSTPEAGLAAVANLPPDQLMGSLPGVISAIGTNVKTQREDLSNNPPTMERPSGAPLSRTEDSAAEKQTPAVPDAPKVEKVDEGTPVPTPEPKPLPPMPPLKTDQVQAPAIKGSGENGEASAGDAAAVNAAIDQLPTTDPASNVKAETPEPVKLEGDANPEKVKEQHGQLKESTNKAHKEELIAAQQPMGENEIYPDVPKETLKAEVQGSAQGAQAAALPGLEIEEGVSIIAQQEHGEQIQSAVGQAQSQMAAKRQAHAEEVKEARQQSQEEIEGLKEENSQLQEEERSKAKLEVENKRTQWATEQKELVEGADEEANKLREEGNKEILEERDQASKDAAAEIEKGNAEADAARENAEKEAKQKQEEGKKETSGGFFGWLASKATSFFEGVKNAIKTVFEQARKIIQTAIEKAKQLATAIIEKARQAIVSVIKRVGDALIAIGDRVLAAFPTLRNKFRNLIKNAVKAAEDAVNKLAEKLKEDVQKALNALGSVLNGALNLLERGLMAAVDAVNSAVQNAIKMAQAAVQALGMFAQLIKDIASDPGGWLRNLGASIMDGIQNHLWGSLKSAVKGWFNQKLEDVLGLGAAIWDMLKQGGINLAQIGQMAFEALKNSIPMILIQLLVEKLASMLVPAFGAIMTIIEGLQAAAGTISRIVEAAGAFFNFMKAVKTGNAGPQFGTLLASGAVAVIDFVANWLISKMKKAASAVAGRIKAMAKRIMKKLSGGFKKAKNRAFSFFKGKGNKPGKGDKDSSKPKKDRDDSDDETGEHKDRLERAKRELPPVIEGMMGKGISSPVLKARLYGLKTQYRLKGLSAEKKGGSQIKVIARDAIVGEGYQPSGEELRKIVYEVSESIQNSPEVIRMAAAQQECEGTREKPVFVTPGVGVASLSQSMEDRPALERNKTRYYEFLGDEEQHRPSIESKKQGTVPVILGSKGQAESYPKIAQNIKHILSTTGMSEAVFAGFYREYIKTGSLPPILAPHTHTMDTLTVLMFGTETRRNSGNLGFAAMTIDLIAGGHPDNPNSMTFERAFAGYEDEDAKRQGKRGAYPMSMSGAEKVSQQAKEGKDTPKTREFIRREMEVAQQWVYMQMEGEDKLYSDKGSFQINVRKLIEKKLFQFFNVKSKI